MPLAILLLEIHDVGRRHQRPFQLPAERREAPPVIGGARRIGQENPESVRFGDGMERAQQRLVVGEEVEAVERARLGQRRRQGRSPPPSSAG
jgi:hypothetical protein